VPLRRVHLNCYLLATPVGMKARQSSKIQEIGDALLTAGFLGLDGQANALGLARSTAWTVLKGNHKCSGLSAPIINRMLAAPRLPPLVREKIVEYIQEKAAGLYGHNKVQLRKFATRLTIAPSALIADERVQSRLSGL
jgi:hypothetical protein